MTVLPPEFAGNPERMGRFKREAQLLASLNHTNIAAIYGLDEGDGASAIVMELAGGPTLAERISQGPIPLEEALAFARQIAEALEAAHENGIIHRDLKPANISVTTAGVADFWNPWACIAARLLGKPLITVIQSHQHPNSPGFIYWKNPPPNLPTAVPLIKRLLGDYGLPKIKTSCDLFVGDLTMVVGTPETDPIPDSSNVVYIGAVLWQNPEISVPDWIANLKSDRPVVWIYPGALRYAGKNRQGEILLRAALYGHWQAKMFGLSFLQDITHFRS